MIVSILYLIYKKLVVSLSLKAPNGLRFTRFATLHKTSTDRLVRRVANSGANAC